MCRAAETAGAQVVVCLHVERRGPATTAGVVFNGST